jgi:hypothetical protein
MKVRSTITMIIDKFNSIIDTLEIKTDINNIDVHDINTSNYDFIKEPRLNMKDSKVSIPMSLNRVKGHYNRLETLTEHMEALKMVLKQFGIEVNEDLTLNRVDIAIDTSMLFKDYFKYFLYMFELLTYGDKRADKWYTTNLNTLQNNTIKQLGRNLEIVFYDKNDESKGRHLYNTRMEFRYKQLTSLDFVKHIDKLIVLIGSIEQNVELLDKNMGARLIKLYDMEMKEGNIKTLSEFARKFDRYIYTDFIMEALHNHSNLKGNYKSWIKNFRRTNIMEFFTNANVEQYQKNCISSLKRYKNN